MRSTAALLALCAGAAAFSGRPAVVGPRHPACAAAKHCTTPSNSRIHASAHGSDAALHRRRGRCAGRRLALHSSASAVELPAEVEAGVVDEDLQDSDGHVTIRELVKFTLPLLVIWLSNPVMSLIDTSVVGKRSLAQLAALGPGTSVCDNISYVYTFLASVTTALVAAARAERNPARADAATCTGAFVALAVGAATTAALLLRGRGVLLLFLGSAPGAAEVLPYALEYTRIRALGFPAVTLTMALQGACLARKDIKTPLEACGVSALTNLVADIVLVLGLGMGITGAAAATTAAQYLGAAMLLATVLKRMPQGPQLPTLERMKEFLGLGAPISMAIVGQSATTFFVTVAASGCTTAALAAHQVIYGMFLLGCPIGEAISQTVQSYLPPLLERRRPGARARARSRLHVTTARAAATSPPPHRATAIVTERIAAIKSAAAAAKRAAATAAGAAAGAAITGATFRTAAVIAGATAAESAGAAASAGDAVKAVKPPPPAALKLTPRAMTLLGHMLQSAAILGLCNAGIAWAIPTTVPGLFSPNAAVWASMREVGWINATILATHAGSMLLQGIMTAQRDVKALAIIYAFCSVGFSTAFMVLRRQPGLTLTQVWQLFYVYQITRAFLFTGRVAWVNRGALRRHRQERAPTAPAA